MFSYELSHRWADPVIKPHQTLSQGVGEQVFIAELTQNFYFLGHWCAVDGGGDEAPRDSLFEVGRNLILRAIFDVYPPVLQNLNIQHRLGALSKVEVVVREENIVSCTKADVSYQG